MVVHKIDFSGVKGFFPPFIAGAAFILASSIENPGTATPILYYGYFGVVIAGVDTLVWSLNHFAGKQLLKAIGGNAIAVAAYAGYVYFMMVKDFRI